MNMVFDRFGFPEGELEKMSNGLVEVLQQAGMARDAADNLRMKNLRPGTSGILKRIKALSGRPVEFKPDSSLTLRATMQPAHSGAPAHVPR